MAAPTLRTSTVQAINDNIIAASLIPEIFPPALYVHGEVVPLPTSPVDGYSYARAELFYLWSMENTGPALFPYDIRLSVFAPSIDWNTGVVTINVWRMPPGGPIHAAAGAGTMRVIVIGMRQVPVVIPPVAPGNPPSDAATLTGDYGTYDISLFSSGVQVLPNEVLYRVVPPRKLNFQELLLFGGVGRNIAPPIVSTAVARVAPLGDTILSIQKNDVEFAIVKFFAGNKIGIFDVSATSNPFMSNLSPETACTFNGTTDSISLVGAAIPDTFLADVGIVLAMKRVF